VTEKTKTPYWAAQERVDKAHEAKRTLEAHHTSELEEAQREIDAAVEDLKHLKAGTPVEVKAAAEEILHIRYPQNVNREDGPGAVRDAIKDLMAGAEKLRSEFFGIKHYEGWIGQRSDHPYGFGPRHGSIVFAIELKMDVAKRLQAGGELTEDEIETAIQFLTNLPGAQQQ
jgi:hypothetical protein